MLLYCKLNAMRLFGTSKKHSSNSSQFFLIIIKDDERTFFIQFFMNILHPLFLFFFWHWPQNIATILLYAHQTSSRFVYQIFFFSIRFVRFDFVFKMYGNCLTELYSNKTVKAIKKKKISNQLQLFLLSTLFSVFCANFKLIISLSPKSKIICTKKKKKWKICWTSCGSRKNVQQNMQKVCTICIHSNNSRDRNPAACCGSLDLFPIDESIIN